MSVLSKRNSSEEEHGKHIDTCIAEEVDKFREEIPIYPRPDQVFRAFRSFDLPDTRVVIIGQDCYPSPGNAMGLCFSVPDGMPCPPSLRNIFSEIERQYGVKRTCCDLSDWADQGVLMLNTALTVRDGRAGSHLRFWSEFTADLVKSLAMSDTTGGLCFMLWGAHAIGYAPLVPEDKGHLVLCHSHPSPLARKEFRGCGHFEKANAYLRDKGKTPVKWV